MPPDTSDVGNPERALTRERCATIARMVHGFEDASTDPSMIDGWWSRTADANVAIPTGASTVDVLVCYRSRLSSCPFPTQFSLDVALYLIDDRGQPLPVLPFRTPIPHQRGRANH